MHDVAGLVSIVIPVFNRQEFIGNTILSAVEQSYPDIEIVVVDNDSSDDTWHIIQEMAVRYPMVRPFKNPRNFGPVRNWVKAVSEARGEYIKILWSDDLMDPDFISEAVTYMRPDVAFCTSAVEIVKSPTHSRLSLHYTDVPERISTKKYIEQLLLESSYSFSPGNALFRARDVRECLEVDIPNKIGSDFSVHAIGNDLLLLLKVAAKYGLIAHLRRPMNIYVEHEHSISNQSRGGKLALHYLLAKAHFTEKFRPELVRKLSALIQLELWRRSEAKDFNMRSVSDFFLTGESIDYWYLSQVLVKRMGKKLFRVLGYGKN